MVSSASLSGSRGHVATSSSCMYSVPSAGPGSAACTYPAAFTACMESLQAVDTCQYYASLQSSGAPVPQPGKVSSSKAPGTKGRSSSYKHIPHRDKPPHLVQRRNARERRRVQAVNSAFSRLRRHIPTENRNKRLSKVKTLKIAMDYIDHLRELITTYDARAMHQQQHAGTDTWQHQTHYGSGSGRDPTSTYYSAPQMYTPNV